MFEMIINLLETVWLAATTGDLFSFFYFFKHKYSFLYSFWPQYHFPW